MNIPDFDEIVEQNDQTEARRQHLEKLRAMLGNVYPNKFERSRVSGGEDTISNVVHFAPVVEIVNELKAATPEGEKPDQELKAALNEKLKAFGNVRVSGRMAVPPRVMGKAAFVHLSDGKERLQIYARKGDFTFFGIEETDVSTDEENPQSAIRNPHWEAFGFLDHGDFIGAEGFLFLTNTGELSVHVETFQFLAKAMLPMPDKMHGIHDAEIRQRQRYVDLIGSSLQVEHEGLTTREVFEIRARVISSVRNFLEQHGYIEVETPMLTPKATGAAAEPFETFHKALGIPLYARIAPELYLKRLVVGGFEKVYELNRNFRNEGISFKHNPEFTMLEFYCAYMDVNGMMDFCEDLLRQSVQKATGGLTVNYEGKEIDFSRFERRSMLEAIAYCFRNSTSEPIVAKDLKDSKNLKALFDLVNEIKHSRRENIDDYLHRGMIHTINRDVLIQRGINTPTISEIETARITEELFGYLCEDLFSGTITQPTFIIDYPKSISPLSKASPENPNVAERFELFINGMEVANGFSELNDPKEQYERFVDQMSERERGDAEAMVMDEDYIRALSYGMPPAAGIGIGIDRLTMLLTNKHSIRDVILFPHMRPEKKDEETGGQGDGEKQRVL